MHHRAMSLLAVACAIIGACSSPGAQPAKLGTRNVILADDIARWGEVARSANIKIAQ